MRPLQAVSDAIGLPKLKAFPDGSLYSLGGPKEPADHSDGHVGMSCLSGDAWWETEGMLQSHYQNIKQAK